MIYRTIYKGWEGLGLDYKPNVGDNGVHASASPFEALAERMNWLKVEPEKVYNVKTVTKTTFSSLYAVFFSPHSLVCIEGKIYTDISILI
jgi:hypothetical protein